MSALSGITATLVHMNFILLNLESKWTGIFVKNLIKSTIGKKPIISIGTYARKYNGLISNHNSSADRIKQLKLLKANSRESSDTTDKNREVHLYSSSKKRNSNIPLDTAAHLPRIPKKKPKLDSAAGPSNIHKK